MSILLGDMQSDRGYGHHLFSPPTSGLTYAAVMNCNALSSVAGVANRIMAAPFIPRFNLTIDQASVEVTANVALAEGRIAIYAQDPTTGQPGALIDQSSSLSFASVGAVNWTKSYTFYAGVTYWLAVLHSSTSTIRGIAAAQALPCEGVAVGANTVYSAIIRSGLTYASGCPDPFGTGTLAIQTIPCVKLRAA